MLFSVGQQQYKESVVDFVHNLSPVLKDAISNVSTQLEHYSTKDGWCFPYTINNKEYKNAWVCSPYTALVSYSIEEADKLGSLWLKRVMSAILPQVGLYLRYINFNKIVHCNNWLLSTNLYPTTLSESDLFALKARMLQVHADKAIVFRSLNDCENSELLDVLLKQGYVLLPTRQIYYFDAVDQRYKNKRDIKRDINLLRETDLMLEHSDCFSNEDFIRAADLYQQLYIKKYSHHNPVYTSDFLKTIAGSSRFNLRGFRGKDGVLYAIVANFSIGETSSAPVLGYDLSVSQEKGLYRLAFLSALLYAKEHGLNFNASSGAPDFKLCRGAKPYIEYTAAYVDHLPWQSRWAWKRIAGLLNKYYVDMLQKYQL